MVEHGIDLIKEALTGSVVQDGSVGGISDGLSVPGNNTCLISEFSLVIPVADLHEGEFHISSISALPVPGSP